MARIVGRRPIELKISDQINGYIPVFNSSSRLWGTISKNDFITGSALTSGSNLFTGNQTISGSLNVNGPVSITGSFNVIQAGITGSLLGTASYSSQALTASNANTASYADNFTVAGTLTAQTIVVQTITSSTEFITGSTKFGSTTANTHQFTGSVSITGSLSVNGSDYITTSGSASTRLTALETFSGSYNTGSFTGSFIGRVTGSFSGSLYNLQNSVLGHIPFFSSSQVLADSIARQLDNGSGSYSIAINQNNITTAAPEALYVYQPSATSYNIIAGKGNLNNYLQLNIQNTNTGVSASSDIVATANNGNESINFIDMGINSEGFTGLIGDANDAYLYSTGNDLHIGNASNYPVQFFAGGLDTNINKKFQLNPNNLHQMTGSLNVSGSIIARSFTGSLQGTASWASNAINATSASYATTASLAINANNATNTINAITASYVLNAQSASYWSGSIINAATASYIQNAQTASYVLQAVSASYSTNALTASNANTASYVLQVVSASFATSASYWSGSIINAATASYVLNAISASYWSGSIINAATASYAINAATASYFTGSVIIENISSSFVIFSGSYSTGSFSGSFNGSLNGTASYAISSSYATTASFANNTTTASFALTASYLLGQPATSSYALTASYVQNAQSASYAVTASYLLGQSPTASYALTASYADNFTVGGTLTAQTIVAQTITSSIEFITGSTRNGSLLTNTHQFTGSVSVTGSLTVNGSNVILSNQTSSMSVATASFALTASYISGSGGGVGFPFSGSAIITGSFLVSSSFVDFTKATYVTGSFTGSFSGTATSASFASNANSASFAQTSSYSSYALYAGNSPGVTATMTQSVAATTWSFTHNLNTRTPLLQVYDSTNSQIIPYTVIGSDPLVATIYFDTAESGYAVASNGGTLTVSGSTARLDQTSAAVTWSFTHNLATKYPNFEIWNDNDDIIIPAGIHAVSDMAAEIYFAFPTTGIAIANFSGINGSPNATTASYAVTATTASYAYNFNVANTLTIDQTLTDYHTVPSSIVGSNNMFTKATGSYSSAFFKYSVTKGSNSRAGEVMAAWVGGTLQFTDNSTLDIGDTSGVVASSILSSNSVQFNLTTADSGWTLKSLTTFM